MTETNDQMDIEFDKQIDPDQLDVEWVEQPNSYYKYSSVLDEKNKIKNDLKTKVEKQEKRVEKIKAKVEIEIRKSKPKDYGLDKLTDPGVKALVIIDKRYQKALDKLFDLKEQLNTAQNDVNSLFTSVNTMSEKKVSLSNLGGLLHQEYFASPSTPHNLKENYTKRKEEVQRRAKDKVKAHKKRKRR